MPLQTTETFSFCFLFSTVPSLERKHKKDVEIADAMKIQKMRRGGGIRAPVQRGWLSMIKSVFTLTKGVGWSRSGGLSLDKI